MNIALLILGYCVGAVGYVIFETRCDPFSMRSIGKYPEPGDYGYIALMMFLWPIFFVVAGATLLVSLLAGKAKGGDAQ